MPYYNKKMQNAANYAQQCYNTDTSEGYKTTWNISGDRSYTRYYYGEAVDANFTYEYTNDAIWELIETDANSANADYDIGMKRAIYQNGSLVDTKSDFQPIANMERPDANVLLFFLSAGQVVFNTQTIDDWYRATHKVADVVPGVLSNNGSSVSVYGQDESASPLACTSQTQLCSSQLPEDKRCTPLGGDWDTYDSAEILFREDALWDMFSWMYFDSLGVEQVVGDLGTQSLKSRDTLSGGIQGPLPANQWQLDIQHWFATASAYQQASAISYATGANANLQQWVLEPTTTSQRAICRNQKILSNAHVSFSFFGICFAFATGSVIILISFVLEPVLGCVQKRHRLRDYARLEWCANETLQLQRLAHEGVGAGTWSRATDAIPMTKHGEPLATLDLEDREHPRLRGPGKANEDVAGLPVAGATGGREGVGTEEVEGPQAKGGQDAGKADEKASLSHTAVTTMGIGKADTEEIGEPQEQSSDGSVVATESSADDSVPQDENASLHLL
ncbi:hypothetical protein SLS55_003885 [Diplodia seriata]|uniref:Uncharacterized protein n=1 Tax=Diplodia seriata TaxID=420778 RepID=A0ABR3CHU7_9PEZI